MLVVPIPLELIFLPAKQVIKKSITTIFFCQYPALVHVILNTHGCELCATMLISVDLVV